MISSNDLEQKLIETSNSTNMQFKSFIQGDPNLQRQDTLKGILYLIEQYRLILSSVSSLSAQQKAKNYHIVYNTISYITQMVQVIRQSNFSFQSIKPLIECIISLEQNLILSDIKYLDKRTQLYITVCKIYQEGQYYQALILLLDNAIKKYEELRKIYQLDQPVPKYVNDILDNNITILKVLNIKFAIQSATLNPNQWKKKVDQEFKDNIDKKLLCLIQCLRTQTKRNANIFSKSVKAYKQSIVQQGFDLVKPHLDILSKGLKQMKQKIQLQLAFKQKTMSQTLSQQQINVQIKKRRQRQVLGKHIKQSQLRRASKSFPLQHHSQLIYFSYQVKNTKILQQLLRCAMIRIQCRRIQVPYITDVKIQVSNTQHVNVRDGYEKVGADLNQANLREELRKLRKSGKQDPNAKVEVVAADQPVVGKDAKKGAKDAPPPVESKPKNSDEPTQWQLEQINHKYVFMYVKKSLNPQKAIFDMRVVLGHQQKGPVGYQDSRRIIVPYIQKNLTIISSQIQQYKGMRQSTQMVPYIILNHSENGLQNQEQKRNAIVDVQTLVGKNPMVMARPGYTKINMDLRQAPEQFVKMPGQTYIFMAYKTDFQFHLSSRLIQLFNSFVQLQNTFNNASAKENLTLEQIDKYAQLDIKYSLEKLDDFFITFQDCLKGLLGQDFYLDKNDFLTNLVFQIWKKYLKNPLQQIQYIMQQRLNNQVIDHDYLLYTQIISKCNPIFLRGLKVLNLIMINNKKCDILLLSKINLELLKLLQENKQYYLAAQNARLGLDRIRIARDQYLSKSVQALNDRMLPFSLTCSNFKLDETFKNMKKKFLQQRLNLQKTNKINQIKKLGKILTQQQLQEAQLEWKLNRIPDEFDETVNKIQTKHSELSSLLASIDLDLTNIYFRVSLKHGQQLKKKGVTNNTMNFTGGELQGLAHTLVKKLGFLATKGNQKQHQNLKQLQTTLIKAQKLPAPKPQASRPQKRLIQESIKNPYKLSLLLLNLGALNSSSQDKKYYLKQSLNSLKKCIQLQESLLSQCTSNSIFLFSSLFLSQIHPQSQSPTSTKPFNDLYNGIYPCQGQKPQQPILVGKNSSTIYLRLPPFTYRDKKGHKEVHHMKLWGKVSANGVNVSANCDQLIGTGIKQPLGNVLKVSHLTPNNVYCFAVSPLDHLTGDLLEIGKTSIDMPTINPIPITSIAANLAKVSYQIGQYDVAEEAAKMVVLEYTIQSKILDPKTDTLNKANKYKLNQNRLSETSLLQMRSIAQTLYVLSLCQKRKLQVLKSSSSPLISRQQKQRQILNLLTLCASLQPALPCPITSLVFMLNDFSSKSSSLSQGYILSLISKQYISPNVRKAGVRIIRKVMKWGLENNQIALVRRFMFRWAARKFGVIGKNVQVEEKREVKKAGKDPKQAQEQKMIDKFSHFMVEKSPLVLQQFQDSLVTINDQYSDLLTTYTDSVKQTLQQLSESMDNGSQKTEYIVANLNSKLQLAEFMKDPINSIGKIANNSKFYMEYNAKIIRRALQICSKGDLKALAQKIQQLQVIQSSQQVKFSLKIFELLSQAFQSDIQFSPQSKNWVKFIIQKTGKDLSKTLSIYDKYQQVMAQLTKQLKSKSFSFTNKYQDYDYLHLWISEVHQLKAISAIMNIGAKFTTEYRIKPIYTNIELLNLENLRKKSKEVQVIGEEKCHFDNNAVSIVQKVLRNIASSIYSAYSIQNWIKVVNLATILLNFINYFQLTPFNHNKSKCQVYLSIISYVLIQMLKKIRVSGSSTYKWRYNKKLQNTQTQQIMLILQPQRSASQHFQALYTQYSPTYFIPQLSNQTSKSPWFTQHQFLNMNSLVSVIVYSVQTLFLKQKSQVVINLLREFCNVTQHKYSLDLLPIMIEAQEIIARHVQQAVQAQEFKFKELQQAYQNQKKKHKKKRQAQITGEKMPYQIQYEQIKNKIVQTLNLLKQQKHFISSQTQASRVIIKQIQRDYNKASLSQKQQKKYIIQFGQDQQSMYKSYSRSDSQSVEMQTQQRISINKLSMLQKNRKNLLKELISKYQQIYIKLRTNKTSKDTLSQILNRNQVGNLYYALDQTTKALQYWNDGLANIFRTVNPVQNYLQVIKTHQEMVRQMGFKELIISLGLIYKVGRFCSHNHLQLQRKCVDFANAIVFKLFKTSLVHPQCLHAFANYRLSDFQSYTNLFYAEEVNIAQLTNALQYFILKSIDIFDDYSIVKALPVVVLYEFLVIDLTKNVQSAVKAKIYKSLILSRLGELRSSSLNLYFVAQEKDLPIRWLQKSDNLKKQKGQNWCPQSGLINVSKAFSAIQNKQSIQSLKSVGFPLTLLPQVALSVPLLFILAKNQILSYIYSSQICQSIQTNQQRINQLKQIQLNIRQVLRKLSSLEECQRLKEIYQGLKEQVARNAVDQDLRKNMDKKKNQIQTYIKANAFQDTQIAYFLNTKSSFFNRHHLIQHIIRTRFILHKINLSRNMFINCFYIIKNALTNFNRYSYGARRVETGYDPEIQVIVDSSNQAGKKDDKKGGKKQVEAPKIVQQAFDPKQQQRLQKQSSTILKKSSPNAFWHIKLTFELGCLLYRQNNFTIAIKIFQQLLKNSNLYGEKYYYLFSLSFIERCKIRLGQLKKQKIIKLIQQIQTQQYNDWNYVVLCMDFGPIFDSNQTSKLFSKALYNLKHLYLNNGMNKYIAGINLQIPKKNYGASDQLTAEQQDLVKKKSKKQQKKAGKDQKKAQPKKDDGKKKKQQSKVDYKAGPLKSSNEINLFQDYDGNISNHFREYTLDKHPNFNIPNIYSDLAKKYIKCFCQYWSCILLQSQYTSLYSYQSYVQIKKLLKIAQVYPENQIQKLQLLKLKAKIEKNEFLINFNTYIKNLSKSDIKKIKLPFEDLPRNQRLILLPSYFIFLNQNQKYLLQAQDTYKQLITLIPTIPFILENDQSVDDIVFEYSHLIMLIIQFSGTMLPKYTNLTDQTTVLQEKKTHQKHLIATFIKLLKYDIELSSAKKQLSQDYYVFSKKQLDGNAKIDEDISVQIKNLDKQCKNMYPLFLKQASKAKQSISSLDILTYLLKIKRESQIFSFSNCLQNNIRKSHRILSNYLSIYKQKCLIGLPDFQKPFSQINDNLVIVKSRRLNKDHLLLQEYIYLLGTNLNQYGLLYGKFYIKMDKLSGLLEQCYKVQSKLKLSETQSQAIKERNYKQLQQPFAAILKEILLSIGSPSIQAASLNEILLANPVKLSDKSVTTLINLLNGQCNEENEQFNRFLRQARSIKYRLKEQKVTFNFNQTKTIQKFDQSKVQ